MRGTDPLTIIHVTEKGEPGFLALAYVAASEDDLRRLAKVPGPPRVENIDEPGGGQRVRLTEPNGYRIEVVHGIEPLPPIPVPEQPMNTGTEPLRRAGVLMRLRKSPTPIKRIGHGVLGTPKVRETVEWFRRRSASFARTTCTRATRTTSSARSTGATVATSTSTTTRSSA